MDYEINEEKTFELLQAPDTYKAKVFTCSEQDTPKKLLFIRNTPFSDEDIEEALYNKGFRGQANYFVIIYNKNDDSKICGGSLLLNARKPEQTHALAGDEMATKSKKSDVEPLMKMYQLGSENSLNTMRQMQSIFGKTVDELSKQNHDLQQELIKSMKRQEREEKAREKSENDAGFNQMLGNFLPLLGQLAGQNNTQSQKTQQNIKPFPLNKNIKVERGNND